MFQGWRLKLREAEEALKQGRLEDAQRIVASENLAQYLPGQRLAGQVADRLAERARHHARHGQLSAGWQQYEAARALNGETEQLADLRHDLLEDGTNEIESLIQAGRAKAARERIEHWQRRGINSSRLRMLDQAARRLASAVNLARRGRFADAADQAEAAIEAAPQLAGIDQLRQQYLEQHRQAQSLLESLHAALEAEQWTEVLRGSDRLLELAPEHRIAREARQRTWARVGARVSQTRFDETQRWNGSSNKKRQDPMSATEASDTENAWSWQNARFLAWVDAVGGFLFCMAPEVTIGQATPGNDVDVPIQADLSRRHVRLRRAGEGYLLEPLQQSKINEKTVTETTMLRDGDELRLGESVVLRFRKPHALSASARLELLSAHRICPAADGVVLMAESCVLGPHLSNHIVCRGWTKDLVLFRRDNGLHCQVMDTVEIDGYLCDGSGQVTLNSRVVGSDFSLSLEAVG